MLEVLGDTLPFAVGMLLSPLPIIAVLLILLAPTGRAGGVAFGLGRLGGVALATLVASLLTEAVTVGSGSTTSSALLRMALGVVLLAVAARKLAGHPGGAAATTDAPRWMASLENASPARAAALGVLLSVANPKELAFCVGAGLTIGGAALPPAGTVGLAVGYAVLACLTVLVPVAAFVIRGEALGEPLGRARTWLVGNNATIMSVVFLIIGSLLIGGGISDL